MVVTSRFLCFPVQFENISKLSQDKVISSTNIKEMEKNLPNFDLGLGYLFPPKPKEKKAKERHVLKEKHNAA